MHGRWKDSFQREGPAVVKFHFTNSKLREKHFSTKKLTGKYQILKPSLPRYPTPHASDAHVPTQVTRLSCCCSFACAQLRPLRFLSLSLCRRSSHAWLANLCSSAVYSPRRVTRSRYTASPPLKSRCTMW